LAADWESRHLFDEFRSSSAYATFAEGISAAALNVPVFYEVVFPFRQPRTDRDRTSINKVYFPAPVTHAKMDSVLKIGGIRGINLSTITSVIIVDGKRTVKRDPRWPGHIRTPAQGGWKLESETEAGMEMQVSIWIHYWTSPEKEDDGKNTEYEPRTPGIRNPTYLERWEQQMRDAGAISFSEEHWQSNPIYKPTIMEEAAKRARRAKEQSALKKSES